MLVCQNTVRARFTRRLNRFLAEVKVGDDTFNVHVPNPARLQELLVPGREVLLCKNNGKKTSSSVYGVKHESSLVGIDSRIPNSLFREAVEDGLLQEFKGGKVERREVLFEGSRFDFLMASDQRRQLVEVKSCSLVIDGVALFPDVPTLRGLRHVKTLAKARNHGFEACVAWVVQRTDARCLMPNVTVQPELELALKDGVKKGLRLYAYKALLDPPEMKIVGRIPVVVAGQQV